MAWRTPAQQMLEADAGRNRRMVDQRRGTQVNGATRMTVIVAGTMLLAPPNPAITQPIDVKAVVAEVISAEIRKCHHYIAAHPDFAKGYGSISMDSYCSCQANLLIGSIATDELLLVDRKLEPKLEPRRRDTGVFCLGLLVKQNEKRSAR